MQSRAPQFDPRGAAPLPQTVRGTEPAESLLFGAAEFYDSLERDIRAARSTICIEMYIWSNDRVGHRFFSLLEEAARRGVRVRLLLDGVGSYFWLRAQTERMRASPVETRIWRPVELRRVGVTGFSQLFSRLNRRNHKKVVVIDETVAYAGSTNVTGSCLTWKEANVRLRGMSVGLLLELFEDAWDRAAPEQSRDLARALRLQGALLRARAVRSNQSYLLRHRHLRALRRSIKNARHRVWLMTPYFVPTLGLFLAMLQAARRGVDVRIVLPRKNDVWFLRWVARLYYRYMLRAGVGIYEWLPSVLHAKCTLVDGWGTVGSSNLNRRSAYLDLELDLVLAAATVPSLEREFLRTFAASERILRYQPLDLWRGFLTRLIYLGRRWL